MSSPLCDATAFARKIEAAYRTMWRHWCDTPDSAATVGNSKGPQNVAAASLRSSSKGHMMSTIVARLGRATASTKTSGTAAYAAEPAR